MRLGGQEQSGRGAAAAPLQYPDLSAALFKYQGVFFSPAGHRGAAAVHRLLPERQDRIRTGSMLAQGRELGAHGSSWPDFGKE